jgi:hypothetical protein
VLNVLPFYLLFISVTFCIYYYFYSRKPPNQSINCQSLNNYFVVFLHILHFSVISNHHLFCYFISHNAQFSLYGPLWSTGAMLKPIRLRNLRSPPKRPAILYPSGMVILEATSPSCPHWGDLIPCWSRIGSNQQSRLSSNQLLWCIVLLVLSMIYFNRHILRDTLNLGHFDIKIEFHQSKSRIGWWFSW